MKEDKRFYEGFDGEKKFIFCLCKGEDILEKLHVWEGFFDDIMSLIPYSNKGGNVWLSIISLPLTSTTTTGKCPTAIRLSTS